MRRTVIVLLLSGFIACFTGWTNPQQAIGAEAGFETVFKNGIYGGLAGALVGTATLAFTDDPEDHLDRIAYGAAIGVIVGTVIGIAQTSKSLVELENGRVIVGLPVPEMDAASGLMQPRATGMRLGFFAWHF